MNKEKLFQNNLEDKLAELYKLQASHRKEGKKAKVNQIEEKIQMLYDIIDDFKDIFKA